MIKFKINKENIAVLTAIGGQLKDMATQTKTIFLPKADSMSVNLYSTKNAVSYSIGIMDFSTDDTSGFDFFSLDLTDLCSTVDKVSKNGACDISVIVDKTVNKITFTNDETGTRISKATFNTAVSDADAKSATTAVDDLYDSFFKDKSREVVVNKAVMNFFDVAQKFMNLSKRSNSIALNHDKARYADSLTIIEKDLGTDVSPYDTDTCVKKALIDFIRPLQKAIASDSVRLSLTENADRAYIDLTAIGLRAVISLEATSYSYPEDVEIKNILPKEDSCVEIETTKAELKSAFELFSGVFKASNWAWENINFCAKKEYLDSNKIGLSHVDYSAECDTTFAMTLVRDTERVADCNLIVSRQVLSGLLDLVDNDKEKVTFIFNSLSPSELNGAGIKITTESGLNAVAVKLLNND